MWQFLLDCAIIIAGFAAAASVFYLAKQIKISINEAKINRSHSLIQRYNNPVFGKMLSDAIMLIGEFRQGKGKLKDFAENTNLSPGVIHAYQSVGISLNFFEEIGQFYNRGFLDDKLIEDFFGASSIYYYKEAESYIKFRMERKKDEELYSQWRTMNETFRRKIVIPKDV